MISAFVVEPLELPAHLVHGAVHRSVDLVRLVRGGQNLGMDMNHDIGFSLPFLLTQRYLTIQKGV